MTKEQQLKHSGLQAGRRKQRLDSSALVRMCQPFRFNGQQGAPALSTGVILLLGSLASVKT